MAVWFGLGGSVIGGFLADRMGPRKLAMAMTVALGMLWLLFGLGHGKWVDPMFIKAMVCAEGLCYGMFAVSLFAIFMGVSWKAVAASQFTAYMAIMNLSNTGGAWCVGRFQQWLSEPQIFMVLGLFQMAVAAILWWIEIEEAQKAVDSRKE